MRAFFDEREARQMAVFKGRQRFFQAVLAIFTLACGLRGLSAEERAQHKPHRGGAAGGFLDAEAINKIVYECGTKNMQEEALKKLGDAYDKQHVAALQLAIAICLEHGKEDERKKALPQYAVAANPRYSDPIDGIWAARRREYLSQELSKSAALAATHLRIRPGPTPAVSPPPNQPPNPLVGPIHFLARDSVTSYHLTADHKECQTPCSLPLRLGTRVTLVVRQPVLFTQEINLPHHPAQVHLQHLTRASLIFWIVSGGLGLTVTGLGVGLLANPTYNDHQEQIRVGVGVPLLICGAASVAAGIAFPLVRRSRAYLVRPSSEKAATP